MVTANSAPLPIPCAASVALSSMGVPSEEKRYSKGEAPGRDIAAHTFLDSESPVSASTMGTCDWGDSLS